MTSNNLVFDLNKSNSNLVQVQRVVTRNGKQFYQKFWVLPSQIDPKDTILSKPNTKTFDLSKFDQLKTTDRLEAMKYAESFGITWNKNDNPGINWMRCNMAIRKAVPLSQPPAKPDKTAKSKPTAPQSTTPILDITGLSKLNKSDFDSADGKGKVNALKSQMTKDELFDLSKKLGVTWDVNPHAGINNMRMQMALAKYLEDKPLDSLTTQDSQNTTPEPIAKVPDKVTDKVVEEVKKDDSLLEIPADASNRDRNIMELINKVDSIDKLNTYKKIGIISEDDASDSYLTKKLLPNVTDDDSTISQYEQDKFSSFNYTAAKGLMDTMKGLNKTLVSTWGMFNDMASRTLDSRYFTAPRSFLKISMMKGKRTVSQLGAADIDEPYVNDVHRFFRLLNMTFGEYTYEDSTEISGTRGANRYQSQDSISELKRDKSTFKPEREGLCVALDIIAESQPDLKTITDEMKNNYVELNKACNYNIRSYISEVISKSDDELKRNLDDAEIRADTSKAFRLAVTKEVFNGDDDAYERWWKTSSGYSSQLPVTLKVDSTGYQYDHKYEDGRHKIINLSKIKLPDGTTVDKSFDRAFAGLKNLALSPTLNVIRKSEEEFLAIKKETHTPEKRDEAIRILTKLFNLEFKENQAVKVTYSRDTVTGNTLIPKKDEKMDVVMSNLMHMMTTADSMNSIADTYSSHAKGSKLNAQNASNESVIDYYDGSQLTHLSYGVQPKDSTYRIYPDSTRALSLSDFKEYLHNQHKNVTRIYSSSEIGTLKENLIEFNRQRPTASTLSNADTDYSLLGGFYSGLHVYNNTIDRKRGKLPPEHPLFNVAVRDLEKVALLDPATRTGRIKTSADVIKKLHGNLGIGIRESDEDATITKKDRQDLLSSVKCSIKSLSETAFKFRSHCIKSDWDQKVHGRNSAEIYGAYEIKNLEHETAFKAACARMGETPGEYYHGTSFGGTQGILGSTGHFRVPKDRSQVTAGAMLGYGIYLADKSSKSAQYFRGYNNGRYGEGSLLLCNAILGKQMPYVGTSVSPTYDTGDGSVCATTKLNSRAGLLNNEWAVRNEDFVLPKILIDMENKRRT